MVTFALNILVWNKNNNHLPYHKFTFFKIISDELEQSPVTKRLAVELPLAFYQTYCVFQQAKEFFSKILVDGNFGGFVLAL